MILFHREYKRHRIQLDRSSAITLVIDQKVLVSATARISAAEKGISSLQMTVDFVLTRLLNTSERIPRTTVSVGSRSMGASLAVQPTIVSEKDVYLSAAATYLPCARLANYNLGCWMKKNEPALLAKFILLLQESKVSIYVLSSVEDFFLVDLIHEIPWLTLLLFFRRVGQVPSRHLRHYGKLEITGQTRSNG